MDCISVQPSRVDLLQCDPVEWIVLQYSPVKWTVLQYSPVEWTVLQYGPVEWVVLQYSPVKWTVLQYSPVEWTRRLGIFHKIVNPFKFLLQSFEIKTAHLSFTVARLLICELRVKHCVRLLWECRAFPV